MTLILCVLPSPKGISKSSVKNGYQVNKYVVSTRDYGEDDKYAVWNGKSECKYAGVFVIHPSYYCLWRYGLDLLSKILAKNISVDVLLKFNVDKNSLKLKGKFMKCGWGLRLSISKQLPDAEPETFLWMSLP